MWHDILIYCPDKVLSIIYGLDHNYTFNQTYNSNICSSLKPKCMPQSNMTFLLPMEAMMQERPTSWPAPRGTIFISTIFLLSENEKKLVENKIIYAKLVQLI